MSGSVKIKSAKKSIKPIASLRVIFSYGRAALLYLVQPCSLNPKIIFVIPDANS